MEWSNVTGQELWDALREVELVRRPRPALEFFTGFSIPKNQTKWTSRLKCNVYYYINNYLLLLALALGGFMARRPLGLVGAAVALCALLSLNDPFAAAVNDASVRGLRRVYPTAANALRGSLGAYPSQGTLGVGGPARRSSGGKVLFLRRPLFILLAAAAALCLWWRSSAWLRLAGGLLLGVGLPLLHATLRSPNLKARLASPQGEFRAVWRGYQADTLRHDFTL
ncbi:hypothetical protein Rsub_10423 [Raphidocelis subcapitata]|uniref:PRA1 family protein n=1 Tax=Raphidocelis subcapitata TaxID=307507 RepID=A0A2V0PHX0_9CHLO|nr:hypothetical protein Rsub_10423 [Raphidocelis subcapitata]|eukprot:GBF97500.1 hypothetical protein Rsub_10423 [Raphidocelis subcapitata]